MDLAWSNYIRKTKQFERIFQWRSAHWLCRISHLAKRKHEPDHPRSDVAHRAAGQLADALGCNFINRRRRRRRPRRRRRRRIYWKRQKIDVRVDGNGARHARWQHAGRPTCGRSAVLGRLMWGSILWRQWPLCDHPSYHHSITSLRCRCSPAADAATPARSAIAGRVSIFNSSPVADYPLGRVGSCLRPGMVQRPVRPQTLIFQILF